MAKKQTKKVSTKTVKKTGSDSVKNVEDLQFEIDQLRKEKMTLALQSISTSLAGLLFLVGISIYLPRQYAQNARTLYNVGFGITLGYWLFTLINITKQSMKIKKLELELKSK